MAVPEADLPGKGRPVPSAAGNRPLAAAQVGAGAPMQQPGGVAYSNRPILLRPRSAADLPDDEELEEEEDTDLKEVLRSAPAWLVSTVFHMLLLIVLGLLAFSARNQQAALQVEVAYSEAGEQLDNPDVLDSSATQLDTLPEQMITPPDLTPVDNPLATPPELAMIDVPKFATVPAAPTKVNSAAIGLALKGREAGTRQALLKKYGGTAATEGAVEAGLEWLVKQQKTDGTWSLTGPYEFGASSENVPAATAMALLAFQGHGETPREGKHAAVVAKGWKALLKLQRQDGLFSGPMTQPTQMLYAHAQCTIAICELYGMTSDSSYRDPAQKAIDYAVSAQDPQHGGWRYEPRKESDTSVTGWFVMAMQSARMGKLNVPANSLKRITDYLDAAAIDDGRRYGYLLDRQESNAVCAEGLLCRQYLGWQQNDPRLVDGVSSLVQKAPIAYDAGQNHDVYYWYYCTQAAHHMEGQIWTDWNTVMRDVVPRKQVTGGPEAGSWNPQGDKWGAGTGGSTRPACRFTCSRSTTATCRSTRAIRRSTSCRRSWRPSRRPRARQKRLKAANPRRTVKPRRTPNPRRATSRPPHRTVRPS